MVSARRLSVVVPVRDEAALLPRTVPALLAAARGSDARIVWVCNGCTDGSAALIRRLAPGARVIECARPGKAAALRAGDAAMGGLFPRIYLDADTWLGPGDLARLAAPLRDGSADMTGPAHAFDPAGASRVSRAVGACWLALPHARTAGFLGAVGVSAAGRARWEEIPDIAGDDIFMAARIPAHRRRIVAGVTATTPLPPGFAGWVRRRARWRRGEIALARLGLAAPAAPGQRAALRARLRAAATAPGALAFVAVRLLAGLAARRPAAAPWRPDRGAAARLTACPPRPEGP